MQKFEGHHFLSVVILLMFWSAPAYAATIFGRISVSIDGFKGYRAEMSEGLTPYVEDVKTSTLADGFFRLQTLSIVMYGNGPIRWPESERNQVKLIVGKYKIGIPTDWIGFKVGDRVFLQPVTCIVDPEGGAYCDQASDSKADLLSRYALRFGISGLRKIINKPVRPKPEDNEVVRPDRVVRPTAPVQPTPPPAPSEPKVYGPTD